MDYFYINSIFIIQCSINKTKMKCIRQEHNHQKRKKFFVSSLRQKLPSDLRKKRENEESLKFWKTACDRC